MGAGVVVRAANADDVAGVWPLTRAFATSFVPDRAAFEVAFHDLLALPGALLVVASAPARDEVVGYLVAHAHPALFANGPVVWIEELMVAEPHRRAGVASMLVGAAEDWAERRDAAYVALATRRAAPFYQALGYQDSATFFRKPLAPER